MTRSPQTWLALMIGNSRLHWAWGKDATLCGLWHTPYLSPEAIAPLVATHFDFQALPSVGIDLDDPDLPPSANASDSTRENSPCAAAHFLLPRFSNAPPLLLASVVPAQLQQWQAQYDHSQSITLADLPLSNTYPTLGIDRALAAVGSVARYRTSVLVIDAGTALTFTGVDAQFRFQGGAILPGLGLQLRSLQQGTAALPTLQSQKATASLPERWAHTTETAMFSGIFYTVLAGVRDFISDWQRHNPDTTVVLTGGDRHWIAQGLRHGDPALAAQVQISPTPVMDGMAVIASRTFGPV
jgi:type III pantothenate kinase